MEFNQENRTFRAPCTVLDTVAEQLTDVDLTLPDYCPDIEKILKCTLNPKIHSKTLSGGQLQIDGECDVSVLYVGREKKTIRCCEHSVSFSQSFPVRDAGEGFIIITKTKPEYINCRALSPRRLVMHGAFSLYAKVITPKSAELFEPSGDYIETLSRTIPLCDLKANCQEQFTVSEEISAADKPAVDSLLYTKVTAGLTDAKAVSGKLLLYGDINISLFYLTDPESGDTAKLNCVVPFQQILDCAGIDENTDNIYHVEVMSYDVRVKNDILSDKPTVAFDAMLCVSAEGYTTGEADIVTDAFCTAYACAPQFEDIKTVGGVCAIEDTFIQKTTVKIEGSKPSKILDIFADSGACETMPDGKNVTAKGKLNLCILALDENNVPFAVERACEIERVLPSADGCNTVLFGNVRVVSVSYRMTEDSAVDVRCELKFTGGAVNSERHRAVSSVEVFDDKPIAPDNCALTLYFASTGESLWDIAKSHNTALAPLMEENSLDSVTLESDRMLLIPKL